MLTERASTVNVSNLAPDYTERIPAGTVRTFWLRRSDQQVLLWT